MPSVNRDWTAAAMENLLGNSPKVRNFKAAFDVELPDGTTVPFELTMPDGALRAEMGREVPEHFHLRGDLWDAGRFVIHLLLYPKPTLERGKEAVIRVVR